MTLPTRAAMPLAVLVTISFTASGLLINLYTLAAQIWVTNPIAEVAFTGVAYPLLSSLVGRFLVGDLICFLMLTFVVRRNGSQMPLRRFWICATRMVFAVPAFMTLLKVASFEAFVASAVLSNICELASVFVNVQGPPV